MDATQCAYDGGEEGRMDLLRRLLGGGNDKPSTPTQPRRSRSGLTPAHQVVPAELIAGWPVIPEQRRIRTMAAAERNELPFERTDCPSCGAAIANPPKGRKSGSSPYSCA